MESVMAEAAEHGRPVLETGAGLSLRSHRLLMSGHDARTIFSVPVRHSGGIGSLFVFERLTTAPVSPATLEACTALAGILGPVLALKRTGRSNPWRQPLRHRGRAALLLAALAAAALAGAANTDYRISAPARVEGSVQRVVVAPFDGYVDTAPVRAGDTVQQGQVIATLQDSALRLEHGTVSAEHDELSKQYRRALSARDWAEARVLEARMAQAQARLDLLQARLERTRVTAPFDGVLLSGDLTRSLGAPVERGQVLFEIAPADGHRVVLQAQERDVGELSPGLKGTLALAALPDTQFPLTVERVSGAGHSEASDPVFLVEARLDQAAPGLRAGMEGVAKITVERRAAAWVLTHRLVEWLQLTLWTLLP
jgi:RND family efflux transporter MFP subunit